MKKTQFLAAVFLLCIPALAQKKPEHFVKLSVKSESKLVRLDDSSIVSLHSFKGDDISVNLSAAAFLIYSLVHDEATPELVAAVLEGVNFSSLGIST